MSGIKKIMVAVDFSAYSTQVTKYARIVAGDLKAQLIFVNVINRRDQNAIRQVLAYYSNGPSVENVMEKLKCEANEKMQKLIQESSCANLPYKILIRTGIPFAELISCAREERVDMVVMGTKGRSDLAGILFGSTAEKMFRRCPVPLLSIRASEQPLTGGVILRPLYISPDF